MHLNAAKALSILGISASLAFPAQAAKTFDVPPPSQDFPTWVKDFKAEAMTKGIKADILDKAFDGVTPIKRVIELDRRQPEFTMTLAQYMTKVLTPTKIQRGKKKMSDYKAQLEKAAAKYKVQPRFIVALWGVETHYGSYLGKMNVVASLATLAYDGRRSKYFRKELMNAMTILNQGHIEPAKMEGSWAGAMGNHQFMPSSFLNFAVDADGDGKKDIWSNKEDIFASAANYLHSNGWRDDQTWGRPVKAPKGIDPKLISLKVKKPMTFWQQQGVRKTDGTDLPKRNLQASLIQPDGPGTQAYLVYNNYHVLLRWNRSTHFATVVGTLSDKISR